MHFPTVISLLVIGANSFPLNGSALKGPFNLQLRRVEAIGPQVGGVNFYISDVKVGGPEPQVMSVLFDVGSEPVILPGASCKDPACTERKRYFSKQSQTAIHVNQDGTPVNFAVDKDRDAAEITFQQVDLGEGTVTGYHVQDRLCASAETCASVIMLSAFKMPDTPFRSMPHDGIIGLSRPSASTSPAESFFGLLAAGGLNPMFAIHHGPAGGEITFGGYNPARLVEPLVWFPRVVSEDGSWWQLPISAVRAGNVTLNNCTDGCRAVIDTGASHLGVPPSLAPVLRETLGVAAVPSGDCIGHTLEFELAGNFVITLRPKDYSGPDCVPRLVPFPMEASLQYKSMFIFGELFLQKYYAVFDWEKQHVGLSRNSESFASLAGPPAPPAPPLPPVPAPEQVPVTVPAVSGPQPDGTYFV